MQQRPTKKEDRWLLNRLSREEAIEKLRSEHFKRITISFYKYINLGTSDEVHDLRDTLYLDFEGLGCLGRIYLAQEGINAQMSIPEHNFEKFKEYLNSITFFKDVPFKIGIDQGESFWKLHIKVKRQIVADGLNIDDYDISNVGTHLDARSFNEAMDAEDSIVVDMRNAYESDIGHFKNAITPQVKTFREELPEVVSTLKGKEDANVLLYCTGGIRCEKASAYLKSKGFKKVHQLYGGIIGYKHQVEQEGLENKFIGANFVFDGRTREQISGDIISSCEDCGAPCDLHINCSHTQCNKLFLQCDDCREKTQETCSQTCREMVGVT